MGSANQHKSENQLFVTAVVIGGLIAWGAIEFLSPDEVTVDDYQTGIEIGKQMVLEAIEGEPGYSDEN